MEAFLSPIMFHGSPCFQPELHVAVVPQSTDTCFLSELQVTEAASKLGAMWKELDDKAKAKYTAQAEKDKERYAKDIAAYKA